ncbi:MAG: AraC family transcriptional regulator [Oscillospiraceae bacterium]|nr:AraC family transcriptional regulator [Oscillospiraceae bacterium]
MKTTQQFIDPKLQDLNPILAGWAETVPGNTREPEVLNYVLLHIVTAGRGKLRTEERTYDLTAGQAFLLFPGDRATHIADMDDPWTLKWVGFTGTLSHSFSQLPTVFPMPPALMPNLRALRRFTPDTPFELSCDLLMLYSKLIRQEKRKPDYVQFVMDYVQSSFMHKISIQSIADQLSIDRSYLARQFKKKTDCSIQRYILQVRIVEAKRCLMQGYSVKETAALCGFNDTANFSKLFAREDGLSPQQWKKVVAANLAEVKKYE